MSATVRMESIRVTLPDGGDSSPLTAEIAAGARALFVSPPVLQTALVDLCTGEAAPASGRISVLGQSSPAALPRQRLLRFRRRIGTIVAPHGLLGNQTLSDNLHIVLTHSTAMNSPDARRKVARALDDWGLAPWADMRPGDAPLDACWRAAVLRAVLRDPELLLVDAGVLTRAGERGRDLGDLCSTTGSTCILMAGTANSPLDTRTDMVLEWE